MDTGEARRRHAASFGTAAEAYERGRPAYPVAALDWLLPPHGSPAGRAGPGPRVLDLGAGTGKLTRDLVARGLDVVAVEPSGGMRDGLRGALPDVPALEGSAERIPLDAGSVDVVLVAQAWHWVDPDRAVPEVARVLRPGGRLGLMWNCREERLGWTRDLGIVLRGLGALEDESDSPRVGPPFGPVARHDVAWSQNLTADGLLDLVRSRSYFIVMETARQAAALDEIRAIIAREPGFGPGGRMAMPYVTRCSRADLPP